MKLIVLDVELTCKGQHQHRPRTGLDKTQAGNWFGYNTGRIVVWIRQRPGTDSDSTQAGNGLDKTQAGSWFGYNTDLELVWIKHRLSTDLDTTHARNWFG